MKSGGLILALLLLTGCQGYKVENGRWSLIRYNEGVGRMATVVEGADQNSFRPINSQYARDNQHVYWETRIIAGADPNTFTCLAHLYAKDGQKVFWRERQVKGADPSTFQIINGDQLRSKDKNDFYFADQPLHVLDLPSFRFINAGWAKDDKAFYATPQFDKQGRVDCHYPTMKILSDHYAVDARRAYYHAKPIEGVDVKTFHVTGPITAKDKGKKYRGDSVDWVN